MEVVRGGVWQVVVVVVGMFLFFVLFLFLFFLGSGWMYMGG